MCDIRSAYQREIEEGQKVQALSTNLGILTRKMSELDQRDGMRVGDWVKTPNGAGRIAYTRRNDAIQLAAGFDNPTGSFFLGDGYVEFSGSLSPVLISKDRLSLTGEIREGEVWFFSEDNVEPHNGVRFNSLFRVFELV